MNNIEYLAEMAAQGDRPAFESIYQQTCGSVYFTCLSFLKNEQDAADITQDVYLTVLKELPMLNDKSKFVPWLNRITVNKCKNLLTKKKPILMDREEMEYLQTEENENFLPEEYITNQAKRKIVMDIMRNTLSDTLYQTVIMYYFNGIAVTEIAEIMGCPVGTVTYRLSVARAKIKEGVLRYEKRNDDKLYSFVGVPFLTGLLAAEMRSTPVPNIFPGIINVAAKSAVAAQVAKKGAKTMFHTLKSKIIAGVVAVAVVGGGITAAVVISNHKEADKDQVHTESSTAETTSEKNNQVDVETTEEVNENKVQMESRWLLQQDFSTGQLGSAPADFTLFNEQISAPLSIEDIKQNFDADTFALPPGENAFTEKIEGSAEEVLNSDYHYNLGSDWELMDGYGSVSIDDKSTGDTVIQMNVYNFSDQEMSIAECVNNGWWALYTDVEKQIYAFLGFNPDEVQSDEEDSGKVTMEYLIQKLGAPNYLHIWGNTVEGFLEEAEEENTLSSYYLAWVFDDYVLCLDCYDEWFYDVNTLEISEITYLPREVWEISEEYNVSGYKQENQIDQLFK